MRFTFKKRLTQPSEFHRVYNGDRTVPMVVMYGDIIRQTPKCYYIKVYGKPAKSETCLHCGKKMRSLVSREYGIGTTCGKQFYITNINRGNLEENFDLIRAKLSSVVWEGLVPKTDVKIGIEDVYTIEFEFRGEYYKVSTTDRTKLVEIRVKSDRIIRETVIPELLYEEKREGILV